MDKLKAWQVIDQVVGQVTATRQQHVELQMALAALKPKEDEEAAE
jgi:hypothetical protein